MRVIKVYSKFKFVVCAILLLSYNMVMAAAFSTMGDKVAGGTTGSLNNAIFYNPATIGLLDHKQLTVSLHYINSNIDANFAQTSFNGVSQLGSATANAGEEFFIPSFYFSIPLDLKWSVGFSLTTPFGGKAQYARNSLARFHGVNTDLKTINFNPVASYKLNDKLILAAGIQIQQADLTVSRYISEKNGGYYASFTGEHTAVGFNLGSLYSLSDKLKFGLSYKSQLEHDLKGDLISEFITFGSKVETRNARIILPEIVNLGGSYDVTSALELVADLQWTGWSRLQEFHIRPSEVKVPLLFKDTWLFALGTNLELNPYLQLHSEIGYEQGAMPEVRRNPRFPTGARTWLGLGTTYTFTPQLQLRANYIHQFFADTISNIAEVNNGFLISQITKPDVAGLQAKYALAADSIYLDLDYKW